MDHFGRIRWLQDLKKGRDAIAYVPCMLWDEELFVCGALETFTPNDLLTELVQLGVPLRPQIVSALVSAGATLDDVRGAASAGLTDVCKLRADKAPLYMLEEGARDSALCEIRLRHDPTEFKYVPKRSALEKRLVDLGAAQGPSFLDCGVPASQLSSTILTLYVMLDPEALFKIPRELRTTFMHKAAFKASEERRKVQERLDAMESELARLRLAPQVSINVIDESTAEEDSVEANEEVDLLEREWVQTDK